jgi:hypothetical protein
MTPSAELLPGNIDLVILKAISLGEVGRRQFAHEQTSCQRLVDAIARSLTATPQEI